MQTLSIIMTAGYNFLNPSLNTIEGDIVGALKYVINQYHDSFANYRLTIDGQQYASNGNQVVNKQYTSYTDVLADLNNNATFNNSQSIDDYTETNLLELIYTAIRNPYVYPRSPLYVITDIPASDYADNTTKNDIIRLANALQIPVRRLCFYERIVFRNNSISDSHYIYAIKSILTASRHIASI